MSVKSWNARRADDQRTKVAEITLVVGIALVAILAFALGHFLKDDLLPPFLIGAAVIFSSIWKQGGRSEWKRLFRGQKSLAFIAAGAVLFAFFAIEERHQPKPLILAALGTSAAALLFVLYLLFSRAMDALWSRWQHRQ